MPTEKKKLTPAELKAGFEKFNNLPVACIGCKNAALYPVTYPCTDCCRGKADRYENKYGGKELR